MANSNVAADVNPLIILAGEKFEPTHVGCYGVLNSAGATGRVAHARSWAMTEIRLVAHSAIRNSKLSWLFSGIQFGMDGAYWVA